MSDLAGDVDRRPRVVAFEPSNSGGLRVAQGGHYLASLCEDAGADYIFDNRDQTSTQTLDLETVLDQEAGADFLVASIIGTEWQTIGDMLAEQPRFDAFAAVRAGNVINVRTVRSGATAETDYFEAGTANPDVLLRDLISIFHPELLPDHEPVFHFVLGSG